MLRKFFDKIDNLHNNYIDLNGFIKAGDECRLLQGVSMDRPSIILSSLNLEENGECHIRVGGSGAILAEGEINI